MDDRWKSIGQLNYPGEKHQDACTFAERTQAADPKIQEKNENGWEYSPQGLAVCLRT